MIFNRRKKKFFYVTFTNNDRVGHASLVFNMQGNYFPIAGILHSLRINHGFLDAIVLNVILIDEHQDDELTKIMLDGIGKQIVTNPDGTLTSFKSYQGTKK